jgi:hypothetical protein
MKRIILLVLLVGGISACDKGGSGGQAQVNVNANLCQGWYSFTPIQQGGWGGYTQWVYCSVMSYYGGGYGYPYNTQPQQQQQYSTCHGYTLYNQSNQQISCQ